MGDYLRLIATATGVSGAFLCAVVFILRRFFEHSLNNELEKTKSFLEQERQNFQNQLDRNLEEYKNNLSRFNSEFSIKLSSIQTKRIEKTEQLYHKLYNLQVAAQDYTSQFHHVIKEAKEEEADREKRVNEAVAEFNRFYFPNRIYFHKPLCNKIDALFKTYFDALWEFGYNSSRLKIEYFQAEFKKVYWENIKIQGKTIREVIPPIIEEIEVELRKIIGAEQ